MLSQNEKRSIKILSLKDRSKTLPAITAEFNLCRPAPVLHTTVRQALLENGLSGRVGCKKPLLRTANVKKDDFAKQHVDWTLTDWHQVLWSDESKF